MCRTGFLVVALLACEVIWAAGSPLFYDPGYTVDGKTASQLSVEWWQWTMSIPRDRNPLHDQSGVHCTVGQEGNVWFLAGGFGSSKIKRKCAIPQGKHLFFPIVNMVYWPRRPNSDYSCAQASASAVVNNDTALELHVELNGQALPSPKAYRAKTESCFDIFARVPAKYQAYEAYPSASDGYWVLLRPLPKGEHTLKFGGRYDNPGQPYGRMVQDIEYKIVVQ